MDETASERLAWRTKALEVAGALFCAWMVYRGLTHFFGGGQITAAVSAWLKPYGLTAPGLGLLVVFVAVLLLDLAAALRSFLVMGSWERAKAAGYQSPMGALVGGLVWLVVAVPHALLTTVVIMVALSFLGIEV